MPKKADPKARVLAFFAIVGLEEARDTLKLVQEILRQRQPQPKRTKKPAPLLAGELRG
jgi:hypothetical protein